MPSTRRASRSYFRATARRRRSSGSRIGCGLASSGASSPTSRRPIAMYLMREETEAPLMRIGEALGGRDHSTVLHGCEKIEREMAENDDFRRDVGALRELLYSD